VQLRQQPLEVGDVVQRQRAVGDIEGGGRQLQPLQILAAVGDGGVRVGGPGAGQHVLGDVEAEHLGGARLPGPAAEPAEAAAEIDHAAAGEVRHQGAQGGPFRGTVKAFDRPAQPAVFGEEGGVVVDVLGHAADSI